MTEKTEKRKKSMFSDLLVELMLEILDSVYPAISDLFCIVFKLLNCQTIASRVVES